MIVHVSSSSVLAMLAATSAVAAPQVSVSDYGVTAEGKAVQALQQGGRDFGPSTSHCSQGNTTRQPDVALLAPFGQYAMSQLSPFSGGERGSRVSGSSGLLLTLS